MLNKKEVLYYADKFGVDISNMKWHEQVKLISKLLREEKQVNNFTESTSEKDAEIAYLKQKLNETNKKVLNMKGKYEGYEQGNIPTKADYDKMPIMIAPEMSINKNDPKLSRYHNEEKLGKNIIVEEISYSLDDIENIPDNGGDRQLNGSYRIKGQSNKIVTALTRGPRTQPGRYWWNTKEKNELFDEVTYEGKEMFLWSSVRAVLKTIHGGIYLSKFKDEIGKHLDAVGNRLGIDKTFTNYLCDEIEKEEKARAERGY